MSAWSRSRPMGADGDRRAEGAEDPAGRSSTRISPNEAFPFLAPRSHAVRRPAPARLFRISFSGELAYELAVPAGYGESVADALMEAGERMASALWRRGARRDAHREGPCHPCNEINGTVVPRDLGFGKMVSSAKADFIGKAMLGAKVCLSADTGCARRRQAA
jgi:glycine cleavage system aminomethyltransferase T